MSNVQLYTQVAAEVSPSLRPLVPEPAGAPMAAADDDFAAEAFLESPSATGAPGGMPMMEQCLRVTGQRPRRFMGRHVAMATGWNNAVERWYEINLYESDAGHIVCDVRLFNKSADNSDLYRVARAADWAGAVSWLEGYDPAHDLVCNVGVDDETLSAADVSLRGIMIRQAILELKTQYQSLVGNLLYELKLPLSD